MMILAYVRNRSSQAYVHTPSLCGCKIHVYVFGFTRFLILFFKQGLATFAKLGVGFLEAKKVGIHCFKCYFTNFQNFFGLNIPQKHSILIVTSLFNKIFTMFCSELQIIINSYENMFLSSFDDVPLENLGVKRSLLLFYSKTEMKQRTNEKNS